MTRRTPGRTAGLDNRRSTRGLMTFLVQHADHDVKQSRSLYKLTFRPRGSLPSRNTGQIHLPPKVTVCAEVAAGRCFLPSWALPGDKAGTALAVIMDWTPHDPGALPACLR